LEEKLTEERKKWGGPDARSWGDSPETTFGRKKTGINRRE